MIFVIDNDIKIFYSYCAFQKRGKLYFMDKSELPLFRKIHSNPISALLAITRSAEMTQTWLVLSSSSSVVTKYSFFSYPSSWSDAMTCRRNGSHWGWSWLCPSNLSWGVRGSRFVSSFSKRAWQLFLEKGVDYTQYLMLEKQDRARGVVGIVPWSGKDVENI